MWRYGDLSERHARRTLLQIRAAPLESSCHFLVRDVHRLRALAQIGKRLLLKILATVLLNEGLAVFIWSAESGVAQLGSILFFGLELRAHCLELPIGWRNNLGLRHLELHLFGFLDQDLFVDEIVQNGARQRRLGDGVRRHLQPLSAPLIDCGEHVGPEQRLFPDDRDDAVGWERGGDTTGGTGGGLRTSSDGYKRSNGQETCQHP